MGKTSLYSVDEKRGAARKLCARKLYARKLNVRQSSQSSLRHATEAHGLRGAGLAALQALGKECLVEGVSDDVDSEHHWREHDVYEDLAHHVLRHALLLEEANLHHERKEERGERAELRRGHEHVDLVRVERRAAEEVSEEEAAD